MSELARYLAGDNYLNRSASGLKRGLSALADSLIARSNEGTENMQAALSGVRVKPGAILTDAGYVMPDASGQPDFAQVGMEREPDVLRALELFGGASPAKNMAKGLTAIFAGTEAKTANHAAHALAQEMEKAGAAREAIWEQTGWFKAPDGKWKWEIDDSGAKVDMKDLADFSNTGSTRSNWLLPHPEIEGAYSRAERGYNVTKQADRGGSFSPENGTIGIDQSLAQVTDNGLRRVAPEDIRRTMLHEMQHGVQREEGFARGGSPEMFNQQADAELARDALVWRRELLRLKEQTPGADIIAIENSAIDAYRKMGAMDWLPSRDARDLARQPNILFAGKHYPETDLRDLEQLVSLYGLDKNTTPAKPMDMYRRLAGEVEARAVQARMNLNPEQRQARPPWQDYDVPEENQIVRMMDKAADILASRANLGPIVNALLQGYSDR